MIQRIAHAATSIGGGPAAVVLALEVASALHPPVPRAPEVPARATTRTPARPVAHRTASRRRAARS
ncbi:hypothetical protein AB0D84_10650 [Streptomyces sp. NPDC048193]|uniref:hypothetical protein n=1 Tax=unclassified Streptomyces TaxID=2593676 RepID=UPI00344407AB